MSHDSGGSSPIPTPQMLRDRAEALVPYLRESAAKHREERRLTPDTIAKVREAGLFKVIQPKRYGGYEMSPQVFTDVLISLAKGDPSMGFAYGVIAVHAFHMGFYDERACLDVWGEDSDVLIASPYIPTGKAKKVEGGYILNGRWPFSSGSDNCSWTFLAGVVEGEENLPLFERMRSFLLPRKDAKLIDTWHVMGLQGTGSKDVECVDVFVPDYRVEKFPIFVPEMHPGFKNNNGPLFRTPFLPLFYRAVSSAAIGALEGMLESFCSFQNGRLSVLSLVVAQDPFVQLATGQAAAGLDEMKAILKRDLTEMEETIAAGGSFTPQRLQHYMLNSTNVPHRAQELALGLMRAAGANGIRVDKNISRYYNDIVVIGQHSSNSPKTPGMALGKMLLGVTD